MDIITETPSLGQAQLWYLNNNDASHDFEHVERVYWLAMKLAADEGADPEIVGAAALLHDSKGSSPGSKERDQHHILSAEFAAKVLRKEGWKPSRIAAVQHCIRSHRFRSSEKPSTIEAKVLFDADKLDVLGAIGAARTIAYAALVGAPIYAEPTEQFMLTGKHALSEPHSAFHEYIFKLRHIKDHLLTRSGRKLAESRHDFLTKFFEQLRAEIHAER